MLTYILCFIIIIHGLIHIMGFVKAFNLADIKELKLSIAKPIGVLWLIIALLFVLYGILLLTGKNWWTLAILTSVASQIIIIMSWQDAKFGTIANIIILVAIIINPGI